MLCTFKISTIQIDFFLGKMYANSYRKKIWRIQYVDNAENRTKWAETILIMRWETSDWNMNDFKFRFLLQHLLNINQNFKVLPEEIETVIFCVLRCVFFSSYAFNETKINNIYIIAKQFYFKFRGSVISNYARSKINWIQIQTKK